LRKRASEEGNKGGTLRKTTKEDKDLVFIALGMKHRRLCAMFEFKFAGALAYK
jgi:hypothetical protein